MVHIGIQQLVSFMIGASTNFKSKIYRSIIAGSESWPTTKNNELRPAD